MVRNNRRKAFTIVELVIVIAVIAILAAVMIPTFTGIIKRANISADEQLAASINTQLSIYKAEGNKIETEADLIKALKSDADFTAQLNPKSAKHGYHYWYNAEKQTVELISNEDLLDPDKREQLKFNAGGNGANVGFAHAAPRTIFPGFYLLDQIVDGNGNDISTFFAALESAGHAGESYLTALGKLTEVKGDNKDLADAIVARMKATVVVNDNGVYYHAEALSANNNIIYFVPGVEVVKATQYKYENGAVVPVTAGNLPTPSSTVVLPSSILSVEKGALNFVTANISVFTSCANAEGIEKIFADASTNATIVAGGAGYKLGTAEGVVNPNGNRLIDANGQVVPNIILSGKLPFEDFNISCDDDDATFNIIDDAKTLYINYGHFAGTHNTIPLTLVSSNGEVPGNTEYIEWEVVGANLTVEGGAISVGLDADTPTEENAIIIKATAKNIKGERLTKELKVLIDKPVSAIVTAGNDALSVSNNLNAVPMYKWNYLGAPATQLIMNSVTYLYGYATNDEARAFEIVLDETAQNYFAANQEQKILEFAYETVNDQKVYKTNGDGSILAADQEISVTLLVDNCLEGKVNVKVLDNSNAVYQNALRYSDATPDNNGAIRYIYVGNGSPIKISDLLTQDDTFYASTLTIKGWATRDGFTYPINTEVYPDISATINGTESEDSSIKVTSDNWSSIAIQFTGVTPDIDGVPSPVILEFVPDDDTKDTRIVELVVVDGTNVYDVNGLTDALDAGKSAILFGDIDVTDNATKINVGSNALYGNGHKIVAKTYASEKIEGSSKYKMDQYLIKVDDGGQIENIYLEGPIYPKKVQYDTTNRDTGDTYAYYVSGVKATGNATISNSYLSGFRSPLQANSGEGADTAVTVDNVTLFGGNFCNLSLESGDLYLNNVTTVQVAQRNNKAFGSIAQGLGAGIVAGSNALNSTIEISGNFLQYNWVTQADTAKLPEVTVHGEKLPLATYMGVLFGEFMGMEIDMIVNKTKGIMHTNSDGTKYLNEGIMFLVSNSKASGAAHSLDESIFDYVIKYDQVNGGKLTGMTKLETGIKELTGKNGTIDMLINLLFSKIDVVLSVNTYGVGTELPVAPGESFFDSNNYYVTNDYYEIDTNPND
ncbi:MAG: type II secretion system protein [Ruminococcaceae bacterium]|nr:type II secretion system protein [Oscillospiraceae bacterium]